MKKNELQAIKSLIKKELSQLHELLYTCKIEESGFFSQSVENTNKGRLSFILLNATRNEIRSITDRIDKLNKLLASVKIDMRNTKE